MTIKKTETKFSGQVMGSKFIPDQLKQFIDYMLAYDGKKVSVTVKPYRKHRSNPQNRYYWGVVVRILAEEWGYNWHIPSEKEMVHSLIKNEFLTEKVEIKGKELIRDKSTSNLNTEEFETLMSSIRQWASQEFNIYIPTPNEVPFEY